MALASGWADAEFSVGKWNVVFADEGERLVMAHADGFAEVAGTLSFTGPAKVTGAGMGADGSTARWRVASSRDGFPNRLALVDTRDNVNGYIAFQPDGEGVSLLVYHRTAFAYAGTLAFDGEVRYRDDAYPCSVTPKKGDRVLSVKSGPAVSLGDDALFSPSADEALHFKGLELKAESGKLSVSAKLRIDDATQNSLSLKIARDWYKSRWVPNWRAPDRRRSPHAPTGWLSWNTYFDQAGSKENLDEARFAAKWFKPFGMEIWNIESWQDNSPKLPVSNFHNMDLETYKVQFPEGMKWLADEIRKLGFRPGLWMAPYGTGNDKFYAEHKDWFLHGARGTESTRSTRLRPERWSILLRYSTRPRTSGGMNSSRSTECRDAAPATAHTSTSGPRSAQSCTTRIAPIRLSGLSPRTGRALATTVSFSPARDISPGRRRDMPTRAARVRTSCIPTSR